MIRRLLASFRPVPVPASVPEPTPALRDTVSPRDVGLRDAVLDGRFLGESGELLKGFAITADDTLLDVGCGEGVATLFAVRQGASVIFTDSELDKVRDLARQVEAQSRQANLGWSAQFAAAAGRWLREQSGVHGSAGAYRPA